MKEENNLKIVPLLIEAKKGSNEAFQKIVSKYKAFIWFEIHKYRIQNKDDCYDEDGVLKPFTGNMRSVIKIHTYSCMS